jgi:hypothetical protein
LPLYITDRQCNRKVLEKYSSKKIMIRKNCTLFGTTVSLED